MLRALFFALSLMLPTLVLAAPRVPQSQAEIAMGFAPVVKNSAPAVVNIYAKIVRQGQARSPFAGDPFFDDFFRGLTQPRPRVQNSLGSGVILSADGLVVSNYHVVGMATDIRVVTNERREYRAEVILADKDSDLALLRLDGAENLPFLHLRDSDRVEVGELALAIGNPFGVGQTVSSGIISGLARTGSGGGQGFGYFIQTDAPINPGNSGGALIDIQGHLIGINTRILSRSGGSNGIGFAIPANLVSEFLRQAEGGTEEFQRPWAGMSGQSVDYDLAEALGLERADGMLISELHAESPFAKAGFRVGDVVLSVDGLSVTSPAEMVFRLTVAGLGNTAEVSRLRSGKVSTHDIPLEVAPGGDELRTLTLNDRAALPGLTVANLTPKLVSQMQLPLDTKGVVVTDPGPVAARVGVQAGDVILAVNRAALLRAEDLPGYLEEAGRWVRLDVQRRGRHVQLRFRL